MGKLQEASRNELLALAKSQTITRYNKAEEYKGFSIRDIKTDEIFSKDMLVIVCRVGDYEDIVALEDILIWVQMCAEQSTSTKNQINSKVVTQAIMNSIDGMDILINCSCPDFCLEENTEIKLLNGQVVTVKEMKSKFDNGEELWVYSTDENGDFKPR